LLDRRLPRNSGHRFAAIVAVLVIVVSFVAGAHAAAGPSLPVVTDFPLYAEFRPNDPGYLDQWGTRAIDADLAWDVTLGSPAITVAVVDTGVWWTHQDIEANMWSNTDGTHGFDYVDNDRNPTENDPIGLYHGTGVSGVIAALTDNGRDVAGVAQVRVMALRALGSGGQGSSLNTSRAIRWASDNGARIINLSLGTNETFGGPTDIQLAVNYAWGRGALIVAAAGNGGADGVGDPALDYPARLPNVVSVAAIDETGSRASFSNYGSGLDIAAPGDRILTLDGSNGIHYLRGTSFAAPFVSGVAALLLSMDPAMTNVDLWNILNATSVQPGGGSGVVNTNYGWGVVNAWNAINAISQPFISVNSYPTSVSRSGTFGVTWSILGPPGGQVTDTHLVWGTRSGALGNATAAQSGFSRQSYTAGGLSIPSGSEVLYFKVVARVNGTDYESPEKTVTASSLPDFLFVLYELLASSLLYLAAIVAFLPQRRAARARRAAYRPPTLYPANYYVESVRPGQPPPAPAPAYPRTTGAAPPIEFIRPSSPQGPPVAPVTPAAASAPAKKRCPSCGTMVSADNQFCFFCGNPFY
jgi:thermitase